MRGWDLVATTSSISLPLRFFGLTPVIFLYESRRDIAKKGELFLVTIE
jgi:hypothetical protein